MNEIETFYWDKRGLNVGYIFFDSSKKTKKFIDKCLQLNIRYINYIWIIDENTRYYGFKVLGIRRRSMDLFRCLKEVLK